MNQKQQEPILSEHNVYSFVVTCNGKACIYTCLDPNTVFQVREEIIASIDEENIIEVSGVEDGKLFFIDANKAKMQETVAEAPDNVVTLGAKQ